MSSSTGVKRLHWFGPCLAAGSFVIAVLLTLGHDQFYLSLNDEVTSTNAYKILGNRFSTQQFNLAIGNTFALLVRSTFAISTSVCFCQVFWRLARRKSGSKRPPTLKRLDAAYSATSNIFNLFYLPVWLAYPLLCTTAVISWLIPVASVITPATLSVAARAHTSIEKRHVPTLDFANLNYVAGMPHRSYRSTTSDYIYNGPSIVAQQIAIAVAAQDLILPINAPATNSSWELTFHAPNIECDEVPSETQLAIERSIYDYLVIDRQKNCNTPPIFAAWYPRVSASSSLTIEPNMAFANSSRGAEQFLPDPDAILSKPSSGDAFTSNETSFFVAVFPGLAAATYMTWYGAPAALPITQLTYATRFENVNGKQTVSIELPDPANDEEVPLMSWAEASSLQSYGCSWDTSDDENVCRLNATQISQMAYQGVLQAFTTLITGHWTFSDGGLRRAEYSKIGSTALIRSRELAVLTGANNVRDPEIDNAVPEPYGPSDDMYLQELMMNSSLLTNKINSGVSRVTNESSTVSLGDMMEDMFRKIVVSYMSSPELTQDMSQEYPAETYSLSKVDVSIETWQNVYVYARAKLWIAYGIAMVLSLCALAFGAFAMLANDATYSNNFSTILLSGQSAEFSVDIAERDETGSDPIPVYLEKATVRLQTGRHKADEVPLAAAEEAKNSTRATTSGTGDNLNNGGAIRAVRTW